jgi:hypothetical protein
MRQWNFVFLKNALFDRVNSFISPISNIINYFSNFSISLSHNFKPIQFNNIANLNF